VRRIASPQLGLFTREQARTCGYSKSAIARWVLDGRWELVHPGVFRLAGSPSNRQQAVMAACLGAGPLAAASHRTAAALHGIYRDGGAIHVSANRKLKSICADVVAHTTLRMTSSDITYFGPVPATVVDRAIMELAGVVDLTLLRRCVDDALRKGLITLPRLRWRLETFGRSGRNGTANLRTVLAERSPGYRPTDSTFEDDFEKVLKSHDIPLPKRQKYVRGLGDVDFVYVYERIAIELDSYEWHGDRAAFQRDRTRSNRLGLCGWLVLRYTWDDVHLRPDLVVSDVREALRVRAATPLQPCL
jgi:very-short-patch-repair endonuclease